MEVREIKEGELKQLLQLYKHLHTEDTVAAERTLLDTWKKIQVIPFIRYFVIEKDDLFVSTCNITILPNLTRGARSIALIENVVTHSDYRKQGLGRKLIEHAIKYAKENNCYKIMLMTNALRTEAHEFYRNVGFSSESKVGFVYSFI